MSSTSPNMHYRSEKNKSNYSKKPQKPSKIELLRKATPGFSKLDRCVMDAIKGDKVLGLLWPRLCHSFAYAERVVVWGPDKRTVRLAVGQMQTTYKILANETGLTQFEVRRGLERFAELGFISIDGERRFGTLITLLSSTEGKTEGLDLESLAVKGLQNAPDFKKQKETQRHKKSYTEKNKNKSISPLPPSYDVARACEDAAVYDVVHVGYEGLGLERELSIVFDGWPEKDASTPGAPPLAEQERSMAGKAKTQQKPSKGLEITEAEAQLLAYAEDRLGKTASGISAAIFVEACREVGHKEVRRRVNTMADHPLLRSTAKYITRCLHVEQALKHKDVRAWKERVQGKLEEAKHKGMSASEAVASVLLQGGALDRRVFEAYLKKTAERVFR